MIVGRIKVFKTSLQTLSGPRSATQVAIELGRRNGSSATKFRKKPESRGEVASWVALSRNIALNGLCKD